MGPLRKIALLSYRVTAVPRNLRAHRYGPRCRLQVQESFGAWQFVQFPSCRHGTAAAAFFICVQFCTVFFFAGW